MYFSRRDYYRDRDSEYELCQDFPGDEILIDGLYSMQAHFDNNGVQITIPVVRVMNTVHYLAAYIFATTCSGDQMEYEALASMSCGRDRQMAKVVMIVLAAMLKRTEGFRAQQCRNVILDNRPPDFELGVTLYDQFLRSAEKRFAEENFIIDVDDLVTQVQEQKEIIEQQTAEIVQLKYIINTMDKERPKTVVINYGTYNDIHDNPYSTIYTTTPSTPDTNTPEDSSVSSDCQSDSPSSIDSIIFTKKAKNEGKIDTIIQSLQKSVQGRKDKTRAFVQELQTWQKDEYVDAHYNARVMYDELYKLIPLSFGYEVFKKYYNNTI